MSRIIAADDDFTLRHLYHDMLEQLGHEAVICPNGQDAVSAFKTKPADLVILDINMPVMDGLEACRQLRRLPGGIKVPVILVSSHDTEEDISAGFNAGANDYMVKPVRESVLIAKLKNYLKTVSLYRREFDLVKNHVIFLERFQIEKVLGYGTHSVVFLAHDQQENGDVAIKLLNENISNGPILQAMMEKVAGFCHADSSRLVHIVDQGQHHGQIYLILEYVPGGDLKKYLTTRRLSEKEAISLARDLLAALEALDRIGLCHLDLKPENVLLARDGWKLTDFGLVTPRQTATMPLHGELWSTMAYAAPENFTETEAGTIRSDIYSLAVTLYEAVTGDNPFLSDKPTLTMFRQLNLIPPPLAELGSGFSYEFSDLLATMLRKRAENRPSLRDLRDSFDYLYQCYTESQRPPQLGYPTQTEKGPTVKAAETIAPRKPPEAVPSKPPERPSFLDKIGGQVYQSLHQPQSVKGDQRKWIPIVLLTLVCLIGFNYLGRKVFTLFGSETGGAGANLPLVTVRCFSCGNLDMTNVSDLSTVRCSKCHGKVGYAMICGKCNHCFPWRQPDGINQNSGPAQLDAAISSSRACPSCHSPATGYFAPAATATRKGGK